ncbi:MAG: hypothetical protein ACE5Z5_10405 [Candidatus Bathyarchaeia archaeon]
MTNDVSKERISAFREDLIKLYDQHRDNIITLSKKHKVDVYNSPNPSNIPQPKFIIGGIEIDMDILYDEEDFEFLLSRRLRERGRHDQQPDPQHQEG